MSTRNRTTTDAVGTADRRRARRPAGLARAAATGISIAGSVGIIAAMARAEQPDGSSVESTGAGSGVPPSVIASDTSVQDVAPTATTVVIEVHRTVYVDEFGNPVDPPVSVVSSTSAAGSVAGTTAVSVRTTRPPRTSSTVVVPTTAAVSPSTTVRTPPPPPSCSGSNCP